jgi:dTDP-4-amino-4,6-dideoxygalactose transaminase
MTSSLALLGGQPIRSEPFPPFPILEDEEIAAVLEVLESRKLSTFHSSFLGGRKVRQFEEEFAQALGCGYAIACNSGTAALHMSLAAIGLAEEDEVIVPPYTFTATASAVLMAGAVPVFVDVREQDFNIDPAQVEKAITGRTRVIIPVHLFGAPAAMDELLALAEAHSLRIVEDCAQAPLSEYRGRTVGTLGDLATFSFQETKNMMTGEGGMVVTDELELAEGCRAVRNHGEVLAWGERRDYRSMQLGWNYRMTEIEAALGICQLARLVGLNQIRIDNAAHLNRRLGRARGLVLPTVGQGDVHVFHIYAFRFLEDEVGFSRATFLRALEAEGIQASAGYPRPLYENPVFRRAGSRNLACPVSERLCAREAVWLVQVRPPAGSNEMDDIADAILKVLEHRDELRTWEEDADREGGDG